MHCCLVDCFTQVCLTHQRGGLFDAVSCPHDSAGARAAANATYLSLFNAQTSASDARNPWVTQFLSSGSAAGGSTATSSGQYCLATSGTACVNGLVALCPAVVLTPGLSFAVNASRLSCDVGCLTAACYVGGQRTNLRCLHSLSR